MLSRFRLAAVLVGLLSTSAHAADWKILGNDSQGAVWSLDVDSIHKSGPARQVWVNIDYRADKSVEASEAIRLYHFDCETRVAGVIFQTIYDQNGAVHSSTNFYDRPEAIEWRPIVPGSVIDAMRGAVCD